MMLHGELSDTVTTSAGKRDAQLAAVLASEQKSFLVALTRADECAVMSAVLNDDHVPSDMCRNGLTAIETPIWNGVNMRRSAVRAIMRDLNPIPVV